MDFHVTATADGLEATSDDPRLHEVIWKWDGHSLVEYGLPGHPVGVVNVFDYKAGKVALDYTVEEFRRHLVEYYADDDNVEAVTSEVAHG